MSTHFKTTFWQNFAASIDMLRQSIQMCPPKMWEQDAHFFYMAFHTTIFLDYYSTQPVKDFKPQLPYFLGDYEHLPAGAIDDVLPERHFTQTEVENALKNIRAKCQILMLELPEVDFSKKWVQPEEIDLHGLCPSIVENYTLLEILFYNFRHVQHHVGQLNLMLRQKINHAPDWIALSNA